MVSEILVEDFAIENEEDLEISFPRKHGFSLCDIDECGDDVF